MAMERSGGRPMVPVQRISDTDRTQAVELLRHHCGEGILTLDEFGDRVTLIYDARTRAELDDVLSDLPQQETDVPETRRRRITRWAVAVMGGHKPKGRIRLADVTNVVAVMGGCELDLRNAEIDGDEVIINCLSIMGGIEIIVPEGISVDFTAIPLLGGTECKINADVPIIPGSPRIIVRALAIMGGVEVFSRKTPAEEKALRAKRRAERAELLRSRALQSAEKQAARLEKHAEKLRAAAGGAFASVESAIPRTEVAARPAAPGTKRGGLGIVRVAEAVASEWDMLAAKAAPEGMVSVLFSEIDSFAEISESLGEHEAVEVLRRHNEVVGEVVRKYGGYSVLTEGEAFLVAFGGASRAMRCAKELQQLLDAEASTLPEPISVRMGLHAGEAEEGTTAQFLDGVVLAGAGIACQAEPGEILVSGLLRDLAPSSGEFSFGDSRKVEVGSAGGSTEKLLVVPLTWQ
ncbi:MAG TPA: DUF1707 domain-containing protein [Acidimicrobiales bacterium]|nr:DUF1707 domain-containing protein [Acidimicrobiales bacterium]